jgi:hypothetical protein
MTFLMWSSNFRSYLELGLREDGSLHAAQRTDQLSLVISGKESHTLDPGQLSSTASAPNAEGMNSDCAK